jgi:hypothetical protein
LNLLLLLLLLLSTASCRVTAQSCSQCVQQWQQQRWRAVTT